MDRTRIIPVNLPNGTIVHVEATVLEAEQDVAFTAADFTEITSPLHGIALGLNSLLDEIKPKKASVELGLEVGIESGKLTALLVKGTGKANLKVTLHWEN